VKSASSTATTSHSSRGVQSFLQQPVRSEAGMIRRTG
jgi:hypothetical protein